METDTIGGLKDHLLRTEQAMEAGVTECKQLNRALGDELRDLVDGPNGVKKNFQDLIDAFRRRLEEKTEELYADQITLESALHSKIRESNAEMGSRIDREVSSKCGPTNPRREQLRGLTRWAMFGRRLRAMDEQLKLAAEARSIAQQTRSNLQMRFEMLELGLDGREASLGEILDAVQQLDGRLEDVEENVTMLDIEAALAEATSEAMGCEPFASPRFRMPVFTRSVALALKGCFACGRDATMGAQDLDTFTDRIPSISANIGS